jgi:hypothetical protein
MEKFRAIFGILSSLAVVAGSIPYLRDIHFKKVRPHLLSWLGWGFVTALGACAMLASGSTWTVAILFSNTLLCLLIVLYSVMRRVGVWSTGWYDFAFFGIGLLGLILWQVLDLPIVALICSIVADFAFGLPTIIKTYKEPESETPYVWLFAVISAVFSIAAIEKFVFTDAAFPIYLLFFDSTVLLFVVIGKRFNKVDNSR